MLYSTLFLSIFLDVVVAEESEGHVLIAIELGLARGGLAKVDAFFDQTETSREGCLVVAEVLANIFSKPEDFGARNSFFADELLQCFEALLQLKLEVCFVDLQFGDVVDAIN